MKNNTYRIYNLADIYNLETPEQIERCIDNLKDGILKAKRTDESVRASLSEFCGPIPQLFKFPDFILWTDDGIDDMKFTIPNLQEIIDS